MKLKTEFFPGFRFILLEKASSRNGGSKNSDPAGQKASSEVCFHDLNG